MKKFKIKRVHYLIILLVLLFAFGEYLKSNFAPRLRALEEMQTKNSVISQYLVGTVAERTGDYDAAIASFEKALEKDSKNAGIISRLYALYLFNGEHKKAIEQAKIQYGIDERKKDLETKDRDPIAYLLVGLDAFKNKDTKKAEDVLKIFINSKFKPRTHLDGVVIPMVLAWAYAKDEDYKNAFKVIDGITAQYMLSIFSYNRALINDLANHKEVKIDGKTYSLDDKSRKFLAEVFFEIGQFSLKNTNFEEAVIYLQLARYLDEDSNKFKKVLGVAYESMGKLKQAVEAYEKIPQSSEIYPEALTSIALAQHNMGEDEKSEKTFLKLGEIKEFKYQSLFGIGTIKMSAGKFDEAIKYFEDAKDYIAKPKKEDWGLYFNLGVAYDRKNNWEAAVPNLKKAVELFPENPESLNYLAYSWLTKNENIAIARKMLEAAVIRSGGAPHILDSYGWALYKMGLYKEALPFLEQADTAMSNSTVINSHLADLYWKLGRKREAKFQWKKALESFDKDEAVTSEITKEELNRKIKEGL